MGGLVKLQIDPTTLEPFSLVTVWTPNDDQREPFIGHLRLCYRGQPVGETLTSSTERGLELVRWLNASHDSLRTAMAPQSGLHFPPGVRGVSS